MAENDVSIINQALINLGAEPIGTLADGSDRAIICSTTYPPLKRSVIAEYPWNCFTEKTELTRDAATPAGKWLYSYIVPGDAMRPPHAYYDSAEADNPVDDVELFSKRRVYADYTRLWADYVVERPESEWWPWFVDFVVAELCSKIAYPITDQQSTADEWAVRARGTPSENRIGGLFGIAASNDAQSSQNNGINSMDFINARFGGSGHWQG